MKRMSKTHHHVRSRRQASYTAAPNNYLARFLKCYTDMSYQPHAGVVVFLLRCLQSHSIVVARLEKCCTIPIKDGGELVVFFFWFVAFQNVAEPCQQSLGLGVLACIIVYCPKLGRKAMCCKPVCNPVLKLTCKLRLKPG